MSFQVNILMSDCRHTFSLKVQTHVGRHQSFRTRSPLSPINNSAWSAVMSCVWEHLYSPCSLGVKDVRPDLTRMSAEVFPRPTDWWSRGFTYCLGDVLYWMVTGHSISPNQSYLFFCWYWWINMFCLQW